MHQVFIMVVDELGNLNITFPYMLPQKFQSVYKPQLLVPPAIQHRKCVCSALHSIENFFFSKLGMQLGLVGLCGLYTCMILSALTHLPHNFTLNVPQSIKKPQVR